MLPRRPPANAPARRNWQRPSPTKSCGIWSRARLRRASPAPAPAAASDTLPEARKAGICRAFLSMAEATYTAKDITVLEGLDPVRKRPGMYIGSTGARGLHHPVYEVVHNAGDEALAGRNDRAEGKRHPDDCMTVGAWGAGRPGALQEAHALAAPSVVLTKLHAGGKFGQGGYKVSGGLHGVGVSVVNALSESLVAEVQRDGAIYRQEFARGEPTGKMKKVGVSKETGTTIMFL